MEFKKARTIYDQIADRIREDILRKRRRPGDRIPSVRETAVETEVNPNTVMRAYMSLQDIGVIVNRRGIGYYVADSAHEKVRAMKKREFVEEELPSLIKMMDLLDITPADLLRMIEAAKEHDHETE